MRLAFLWLLSTAIACSQSELNVNPLNPRSVDSNSSKPSTAIPANLTTTAWQKSNLTFCWNVDEKWSQTSEIIQAESFASQKAREQFSTMTTGVAAIGFEKCTQVENPDVIIIWTEADIEGGAASHFGRLYGGTTPRANMGSISKPAIHLNPISINRTAELARTSFQNVLAENLLHEIGHIVGLFHEHGHPQSTCSVKEDTLGLFKQFFPQLVDTVDIFAPTYDPYSVMSYCKTHALLRSSQNHDSQLDPSRVQPGLSLTDKSRLRDMYKGLPQDAALIEVEPKQNLN